MTNYNAMFGEEISDLQYETSARALAADLKLTIEETSHYIRVHNKTRCVFEYEKRYDLDWARVLGAVRGIEFNRHVAAQNRAKAKAKAKE